MFFWIVDEVFKPFPSSTTPSPPKFNVNVNWGALAPKDKIIKPPKSPLLTSALKYWDLGVRVQHRGCCRVWIFCLSTVVSDIDTYHKSTLVLPSQTNWRFEPSLDNCCRLANAALGTAWSYRNCKLWPVWQIILFATQLCSLWNRCIHRSYGHTFISASGPTTGEKKKGKEQVRCHRPGILGMARSSWLVAHLQRLKMGYTVYTPQLGANSNRGSGDQSSMIFS
jgi:hypothetical protein